MPAIDDRLTIDPPPLATMAGTACLMPKNTPVVTASRRRPWTLRHGFKVSGSVHVNAGAILEPALRRATAFYHDRHRSRVQVVDDPYPGLLVADQLMRL